MAPEAIGIAFFRRGLSVNKTKSSTHSDLKVLRLLQAQGMESGWGPWKGLVHTKEIADMFRFARNFPFNGRHGIFR